MNENSVGVRLDLEPPRVLRWEIRKPAAGSRPRLYVANIHRGHSAELRTSDLAANVLIVGHHGSTSSSRKAFLDAVASSVAVVSSVRKKYSGVKLPDEHIIHGTQSKRASVSDRYE